MNQILNFSTPINVDDVLTRLDDLQVRHENNEKLLENLHKFGVRDVTPTLRIVATSKATLLQAIREVTNYLEEQKIKQNIPQYQIEKIEQYLSKSNYSRYSVSNDATSSWKQCLSELVSFPENDRHTIPSGLWGPGGWTFLESKHQWGTVFRNNEIPRYIRLFQYIIPTLTCRKHFIKYVNEHPPEPGMDQGEYIWNLHNAVNARHVNKSQYPRENALKTWAKPDLSNLSNYQRKNLILFRSCVNYANNAHQGLMWCATSMIEKELVLTFQHINPGSLVCKVVRVYSCRTSMIVLFYVKSEHMFMLTFYSGSKDQLYTIFLADTDASEENSTIYRQLKVRNLVIPHVKRLYSVQTTVDREFFMFTFTNAFDETSSISVITDMLHENFVDTNWRAHVNCQWMTNNLFFNRSDIAFMNQLIHWISLLRKSPENYLNSYMNPMGPIELVEIHREQYKHSIFDFEIHRKPGNTEMLISKFGEQKLLNKTTDLKNKKISIHMIEDHWQTGLLIYFEMPYSFLFVPLNPYNNNESTKYSLTNVVDCIVNHATVLEQVNRQR